MDIYSVIGTVIVLLMFGTIFSTKTTNESATDEPESTLAPIT